MRGWVSQPHLRLVRDARSSAAAPTDGAAAEPPTDADWRFAIVWALQRQLLDLRDRARETYARQPPTAFDGLGALLDELLPEEDEFADVVARAVCLAPVDLRRLRAGVVDPLTLPSPAVVRLAEAAGLGLDTLECLTRRDHAALNGGAPAGWAPAALAELRAAWVRAQPPA